MYDDKSELARAFTVIWCLVPPFKIIRFLHFYEHIAYQLSNMPEIKRDIDQQILK